MKKHFKRFWIVYAWSIIIAIASCLPGDSKESGWMDFPHADKLFHALFYCIYSVLIIISATGTTGGRIGFVRKTILALVLVAVFGSIMEGIQHYLISTRTGDPMDILFNISGWVIAVSVMLFFEKRFTEGRQIKG